MVGLENEEPLRKIGLYGYDSHVRYHPVEKVTIPSGLGIVEEFTYLKQHTGKPTKVTCPGPFTFTINIRLNHKKFYKDRLQLVCEFAEGVNDELKALVEVGAKYIKLDEPSYAIVPGGVKDWVSLFTKTVEGVNARIALHICFGNLGSRPRGKRSYAWMLPDLLDDQCDELVLEFANREMKEVELCCEISRSKDVTVGVVDIKSFYQETPQYVAERIREVLDHVPPDKLTISPDCGFFQIPRWLSVVKLKTMVEGARLVRNELTS